MDCNSCGNPTTNRCTRCDESPYCGAECQRQHWPSHRDVCKDNQLEKALQRVADILLEAYLTFRQNTWHINIARIEVNYDEVPTLMIHDGDQSQNKGYFVKFPSHLFKDKPELRMTMLSAWHCSEPYSIIHALSTKLLHGLNIDVEEINVKPTELPWKVTAVVPNGSNLHNSPVYKHAMLRLTSRRTQKQWVIDVCGGQYGIYQPLHEWNQYLNRYKAHITATFEPGFAMGLYAELGSIKGNPAITFGLVNRSVQVMDKRIDQWENRHNVLSQLRNLDGPTFDKKKASLLRALDSAVRTYIARNDFTSHVRRERHNEAKNRSSIKCANLMKEMCKQANKLPKVERK